MRFSLRKFAAAAATAAVTGLLTAAVVQAQLSGPSPASSHAPAADPAALPKVTAVLSSQANAFAVLRRTQRTGDAIDTSTAGPFGANLRLARAITTAAGVLRVVPANGHVCLRGEDSAGALWVCAPTADATTQGVVMTSRSQTTDAILAVYAVLPDGASDIALSGPTGKHPVTVTDNVVAAGATNDTTLSFRDSSDTQHTLTLP